MLVCIVVVAVLGLVPGFITAHIIDSTIPNRNLTELGIDVGIILASALLTAGVGVVQGYLNSVVGEGIMRDIRTNLVAHLHRMPLQFFAGTKTGEIMNRVSNDVDNVDNVVTGTLTSIVTNFVLIATTVVAMFVWNWRLALLSVIIVPLMVFPLGPVGRRMYQIRKLTREKRDEIESITQETLSISGITLIKSFAREAYERARFYRVGTNLMQLEINLAMVGRWFLASVTAMVVVGPQSSGSAAAGWPSPRDCKSASSSRSFRSFKAGFTGRPQRSRASRCRSSVRWRFSSASLTTST